MKRVITLIFILALVLAILVKTGSAQTREQTTIQTTTFDVATLRDAVTISYLNLPWGEATFGYIEHGTKGSYYGERTWPFAQLETKVALTLDGTRINPGQYALVITPGADVKPMSLSIVPFEGPTFLKPGNIFSPTPKGMALYNRDISFQTFDGLADHMKIDAVATPTGFDLVVNYGNRKLAKSFTTK